MKTIFSSFFLSLNDIETTNCRGRFPLGLELGAERQTDPDWGLFCYPLPEPMAQTLQ